MGFQIVNLVTQHLPDRSGQSHILYQELADVVGGVHLLANSQELLQSAEKWRSPLC